MGYDLAVIGGGIGGLAAAAYAARSGAKVVLLEQTNSVGGRAATLSKGEFRLNLGPHALYQGVGLEVLRELGVVVDGAPAPTSGLLAFDQGKLHTLPSGFVSLLSTGLLGLGGKIEIGKQLAGVAKIDLAGLAHQTVREWIEREVRDEAAARLVEALLRLASYSHAPEHLSAGAALGSLQAALRRPVLYLHGGWGTIVDGLETVARGAGVEIRQGARVERVEIAGGAVRGVRLAGEDLLKANSAIVVAGPDAAAALAPEIDLLAQWARAAVPVRAACLDLALARLPRPRALFALGIDRPLYLSVHSATARLAPAGGAVIHLAKYLDPFGNQDAEADLAELEGLLEAVQPGSREAVVERRWRPHLTVMHALAAAKGGGLGGRPGPAVAGVRGLWVAGDWVGAEGMLADASLASARRAATEFAEGERARRAA